MTDVRFACPSCRRSLRVSGHHALKKTNCPGCGQRLQVPALPKQNKTVLGELEQSYQTGPAPLLPQVDGQTDTQPLWTRGRIVGFSVGAGGVLLALAVLIIALASNSPPLPASLPASSPSIGKASSTPTPPATIELRDILSTYEESADRGESQFRGKELQVSGAVLEANVTTRAGETFIYFSDRGRKDSPLLAVAFFYHQDAAVLSLRRGDPVRFSGTCTGLERLKIGVRVTFSECKVLP